MTDEATTNESDLATEAVAVVRRWLAEGAGVPADPAAERLAGVLKDPNGLDFAMGFVDGVMRPEDPFVAGYNLQRIAPKAPQFLPAALRLAIAGGGVLGPVLPWVVVPVARRALRSMVGHLVVDATPDKLGPALAALRGADSGDTADQDAAPRLNLNLLGEAVLGEAEAARRLAGTRTLLQRDDVDYVSIKVSAVISQVNLWAFEETVASVVDRLTPLYELAAEKSAAGTPTFINLDMEDYHDLDLTRAVFIRLLDLPQLQQLEAGLVLQAYLPDSGAALDALTEWAVRRRAAGGAPIKVRLVKGANLPMEQVDATLHGWPQAPFSSKAETDSNYLRLLDRALTSGRTDAVRIGVAGHNLFFVAWAWLLATGRGVTDRIDFEMLLGMAPGHTEAVHRDVGRLLLYTPVVNPAEFDVAINYLVRRLQENASPENFMSVVYELAENPAAFEREKRRFLDAVAAFHADPDAVLAPQRTQDRRLTAPVETDKTDEGEVEDAVEVEDAAEAEDEAESIAAGAADAVGPSAVEPSASDSADSSASDPVAEVATSPSPPVTRPRADDTDPGLTAAVLNIKRGSRGHGLLKRFENTPDTDPSLAGNREWGRGILARVSSSTLGESTVDAALVTSPVALDRLITAVARTGTQWGNRMGIDRAQILHAAGDALEASRARLIEVMAAETGKTLAEADPEVSEAVDFAHYYAERAGELDRIQGAVFVPSKLTVVTPPWNFPVAIPAGSVLSALAAGSGVILKPAHAARRSAAVLVEALWQAGVPRDLLVLVTMEDGDLSEQLISHPTVDRVILTGSWETAKLFRSWRPDLPLLAETSGKNAIIVTPSADVDQAVTDVVRSAFGHSGQKCSAASLLILVGSMGKSDRFQRQLVDATKSLRMGFPDNPVTRMGPLIEAPTGKLLHALTELGGDEKWLVEPQQLDKHARLWSPGIRTGVAAGSYFHLTEFFGPVLGVMRAHSLEEAIRIQNAVEYGLTAGLHTREPADLALWLDTVQAGNLYVNRGITGAIVQRQPFGGWKRSSVGPGTKAGGPNQLFSLGSWATASGKSSPTLHLRGLQPSVIDLIEASQSSLQYAEFDVLRRSALSDALAWREEFGQVSDAAGLGVERNLFRYRPTPVTVRLGEADDLALGLRVIAAGLVARSRMTVSAAVALPAGVVSVLSGRDIPIIVESDADWLARVAYSEHPERVRLVGGSATSLAQAVRGNPDVAIYDHPVTQAGRIELLPFLKEQAISITAHRYGSPDTLFDAVI